MATSDKTKRFDCVRFMRDAREQISREITGLDHDQLVQWFASQEYSDPALARLAKKVPGRPGSSRRQTVTQTELNPYPAYRNSGVEWLGDVPAHWEGGAHWGGSDDSSRVMAAPRRTKRKKASPV